MSFNIPARVKSTLLIVGGCLAVEAMLVEGLPVEWKPYASLIVRAGVGIIAIRNLFINPDGSCAEDEYRKNEPKE
jgi:hypothetical protein